MRRIVIRDCSFSHLPPNPPLITGFDDEHRIEVTMENVTIGGIPCSEENETSLLKTKFADISYK
jgi:hypothetical protein